MGGAAQLRLFGGFALRDAEGRPVPLTLRKTEGLIAYLAVGTLRRQSRPRLAGLLWSESSEARALQSLRQARLILNRDLAPHGLSLIEFGRREIRLDDTALKVDAVEFSKLREAGDPDSLTQAVECYRGEFLAGIELGSEAFEEWLQPTRAWYREQLEAVLERLLVLQEQAGAYEACIRTAKRILAVDPLREDMHRWLMRAFAAAGQRTSALAAYDACRAILQEDLGVRPEAETEALHTAILHNSQQGGRWSPLTAAGPASSLLQEAVPGPRKAAARPAPCVPLSNFSPSAQEVLRIAAICHDHFSFPLLEEISERPAAALHEALRELQLHGLLQWDPDSQSGQLSEDLQGKVAGQMLPSLRRHLHYAAAEALGRQAGDGLGAKSYEIAEHYREAEKWEFAAGLLLRLTRLEIDQGNLKSAEALLQRAQADLAMLEAQGGRARELAVETALLRVTLAEAAGNLEAAEEILEAAWPGLKALGPSDLWVGALLMKSRLCHRHGRLSNACAAIRMIPEKCLGVPNEQLWRPAERFADAAGVLTYQRGRRCASGSRAQGLGPRAEEADRLLMEALRTAKQDRYTAAYSACDQAIRLAGEMVEPTALIVALQTLGLIQIWDGDAKSALQSLERAAELAREHGDLLRQYTSCGYLGFALISAGRSSEGLKQLATALEMARKLELRFMTAMFSAWYAEALVDSGEVDEALKVARSAAGHANERNEPWARSVALRVLGQALARSSTDGGKLVDKLFRSAQDMQNSLGLVFESERTASARAEASRTTH